MTSLSNLPDSLSPHVCLLQSQDLVGLLNNAALPPLPRILQSVSPLPQITTRTTTLTPVTHTSFALRFSDLSEVEESCREPEEQRAERTIDWIGARITKKSARWLEVWENSGAAARERDGDPAVRTPWWEELRQCVEGDRIPSRVEGWNHPVAIIVAVSTLAPNPLQALAQLHSHPLDFPSWVDSTNLRYTLIVHPKESSLSDEEVGALFNAVKRQYGLHTFLLSLDLTGDVRKPVLVPTLPCLPPLPRDGGAVTPDPGISDTAAALENQMLISENDTLAITKFVREFATMSLIPWMEKCVLEWNDSFSSSRRLPSRLFTSTRRLFGSSQPASPVGGQSPNSVPIRTYTLSGSISSTPGFTNWTTTYPQQRRLAEFATILGDFKLAIQVWESARRDSKGGSEVLPFLLSPSPATVLHVQHALSTIAAPGTSLTPAGQLRALTYAVRWAVGIGYRDLLSEVLEGERWLVWAAASAEEPPQALLLAHAASLSAGKRSTRRAALWYLLAANKLEGFGIKSLTMHFLHRSHQLYTWPYEKQISPSFWDADDIEPTRVPSFDSVIPGIEYALGRLHYTTGNIVGAVQSFLSILNASQKAGLRTMDGLDVSRAATDKGALDDFRTAFQHLQETANSVDISDFDLPISFSDPVKSNLRVAGYSVGGDVEIWEVREESWREFWRSRGKEVLESSGKAAVNEAFWIDLVLSNPLNVEVNLSNLTAIVRDTKDKDASVSVDSVDVEVLADLVLGAKETCTIPLSVRASSAGTYFIAAISYDFLSLLPAREALATRGRRLQDTPTQRQGKIYAPDVFLKANVENAAQRLAVTFVDDGRLVLSHGECQEMRLWLSNAGTESIDEIWLVPGAEDVLCIVSEEDQLVEASMSEIIHSTNTLQTPSPYLLPSISLQPGDNASFSIILHANQIGDRELCLLFVYRKQDGPVFHSTRVTRSFEVEKLMHVELSTWPSRQPNSIFQLQAVVSNISPQGTSFALPQLSAISSTWSSTGSIATATREISSGQTTRFLLDIGRDEEIRSLPSNSHIFQFVSDKLRTVLLGHPVDESVPPAVELFCNHITTGLPQSFASGRMRDLLHIARRNEVEKHIARQHPHLPPHLYSRIFPLQHPYKLDIVLSWSKPEEQRSGFTLVSGPIIGASHGMLDTIIREVDQMKVKRIMYAETHRENSSILEAIRNCEWNAEMNPVVATVHDLAVVEHKFGSEPCVVPVTFILRNFSLTRSAKYALKLAPPDRSALFGSSDLSPPNWIGRLTYRGNLGPLEHTIVRAQLCIPRPDTYLLDGWTLEVEVVTATSTSSVDAPRHYEHKPAGPDVARLVAIDISY